MNPFGRFDDSKREYVITRPDTPLPWLNYPGQDEFFGLGTSTAGGYASWRDAKLRRLTHYGCSGMHCDPSGRFVYDSVVGTTPKRDGGKGCQLQRSLRPPIFQPKSPQLSSRGGSTNIEQLGRIGVPDGGVSETRVFKLASRPHPRSGRETQARHIDPQLCFVLMPYGLQDLTVVYQYYVKPSIEVYCGLRCQRGDDLFGSNVVMDDIRRSIHRARVVIADLTGKNPNVFYEVGIAYTLNKDVLLLAQSIQDVPFDLRHRRVLAYEYTPKGCKELERSIVENVNAMLAA